MNTFFQHNIKHIAKSLIVFIIAKGVAFLAPIILLKVVSLNQYGIVEYAYSLGSVLAIAASCGFYGAYPYFILKKKDIYKIDAFLFYGIPGLILTLIFILLYYTNIISTTAHFVVVFTLIFSIQRLLSSYYKTDNKGYIGVLFDSGYYFLLSLAIIILSLLQNEEQISVLLYLMQFYLIALCIFLIYKYINHKKNTLTAILKNEIPEIVRFSYKMVLSGFIVYWLTSSARIYISWYMGYENVGIYSFYFRMAGISVILYQFLSIVYFKKLYTLDNRKMDLYYSIIMLIIFISCFICSFFIPEIALILNKSIPFDNMPMYYLLCLQMPIWVGFALCEAIIGRENVVGKFNLCSIVIVIVFPLILYCLKDKLTLSLYTYANTILFVTAYAVQLFLLCRKGIFLKRCIIFNLLIAFISSIYYFSI